MRTLISLLHSTALCAGLALLPVPAMAANPVTGQVDKGPQVEKGPQVVNPVDDFKRSLDDVKKNLGSLNGKIEQSSKDIEKLTSTDAARQELTALQALIADALGTVSDNGQVASLGQKVLDFAKAKQKQFETDTKYTPEERQFLQKEWSKIAADAKRSTDDLSNARQEFAKLLRTVQTRSDYIEELQALNNAEQLLQVIRQLADEIRTASGTLKTFIQTVTPPSPGT